MVKLNHQLADPIIAACRENARDVAAALSAALERSVNLTVGEASIASPDEVVQTVSGPGLVVLLYVGPHAALLAIPLSSGLLPKWYAKPDTTGTSKLQTLAQELAEMLLPRGVVCERHEALAVSDLAQSLRLGDLARPADHLTLLAQSREHSAELHFVWPLREPSRVVPASSAEPVPAMVNMPKVAAPAPRPPDTGDAVERLPSYSRGLLSIQVPLVVTLAATKKKVREILQLGPGAIIQFEKSCEEMLDLEAGNIPIAAGEAVKVGDKFGLRITSVRLPEERMVPVT